MKPNRPISSYAMALGAGFLFGFSPAPAASATDASSSDGKKGALTVRDQHSEIGIPSVKTPAAVHTSHPDAQWYPGAGLGLFLHWSISADGATVPSIGSVTG